MRCLTPWSPTGLGRGKKLKARSRRRALGLHSIIETSSALSRSSTGKSRNASSMARMFLCDCRDPTLPRRCARNNFLSPGAARAIIQDLVNDDTIGRVALATLLYEAASEILSGIPLEQLNDTVNVPRWWN